MQNKDVLLEKKKRRRRRRVEFFKKVILFIWWVKGHRKKLCIGAAAVGIALIGVVCAAGAVSGRDKAPDERQSEEKLQADAGFVQPGLALPAEEEAAASDEPETSGMLEEYAYLYEQNNDLIGWLSIDDTVIDYPVMQTPEDEEYYIDRDFYRKENSNGCLIMDTDSVVGVGTAAAGYETEPSTNLIIHGHTMGSGAMFGNLQQYAEEEYGRKHSRICFDSLYEKREYELIAAFYTQVYREKDEVFKYYKFFRADKQEEFDDWYQNIKKLSVYDTGVSAEYGDEFITLSCCAYHVENGRFVVVGKRIK